MLAISTYWFDSSKDNVESWLKKIKDIGFDSIELGYRLTRKELADFEKYLKPLKLSVSSIHNFCPSPDDESTDRHPSNHYRLSSVDKPEARKAVFWTKSSIDTAKRVGAGVVVIHAGTMDFEDIRAPYLYDLFIQGKDESPEFAEERERILKAREKKRGPHLMALERSLKEVTQYAFQRGIKIGLETRYYPIEMPNFDEINYFLKKFDSSVMGYWHDVGHAEMNSRLGVTKHEDFLNRYKDRLIGVHLHGILGKRDHMAPFDGDMDLNQWMPYFGKDIIKVVEAKFATEEQLRTAVSKLKKYS
jgi:sugar phosphate isomerase/epimerase